MAGEEAAQKVVHPGQLDFLTDPSTGKDRVVASLGNPDLIWATAQVFVYHYMYSPGFLEDAKWGLLMIQFGETGTIVRLGWRLRPQDGNSGRLLQQFVLEPIPEALALPGELSEFELRRIP
jgi:hypothetical protein